MRIDKIEIDGFGKLNDFSMTFQDGFHLILGDNESGKSTLCAFLLCMFYDMPNDGKRLELSESMRRKYKPWNQERFGGRVFFTHEGKQYILEKAFGTTKRTDRAKLLDAQTWDECGSAENVGERFFGLGREGFLKTLYITSMGADAKDMGNDELFTRLSNLETSGDEDISYVHIQSALEKEQYSILTKTGKGGKLATLRENLQNLEAEKLAAMRFLDKVKEEREREITLKTEIAQAQASLSKSEEQYQIALRHKAYLSQKKTEESGSALSEKLAREQANLSELEKKAETLRLGDAQGVSQEDIEKAKILEKELFHLEHQTEEKEKTRKIALEQNMQESKRKKVMGLWISALLFAGFCVAGVVYRNFVSWLLMAIVGLMVSVAMYLLVAKKKNGQNKQLANETEIETLYEQIAAMREEIKSLCIAYAVDSLNALFEQAMAEKNAEEKLAEYESRIKKSQEEITSLKESLSGFEAFEKENFSKSVMEYDGASADVLFEQIQSKKTRLAVLQQAHYELSVSLAKQTAGDRSVAEIDTEILVVKEQIQTLEKRYAALEKAGQWLVRAHGEIQKNYAPRLNQKTAEIFCHLTHQKYDGVKLGENFTLNYRNENNEIVDASYLSGGTYDLLYIALRFAALSVLFDGVIPPIIADDALMQLDDARLRKTVEYMCSASFGQVLYFTCRKTDASLFDNQNVTIIEL